jgi:hypothetical protein
VRGRQQQQARSQDSTPLLNIFISFSTHHGPDLTLESTITQRMQLAFAGKTMLAQKRGLQPVAPQLNVTTGASN